MNKIVIFGNSGSGKSTLAKQYSEKLQIAHLDLDSLAWQNTIPPQRRALNDSITDIQAFLSQNDNWVIEGCYADLLEVLTDKTTKMIFVNPGVDTCIANCKNRPWEPHKYESKQSQDENLDMLIEWITQYPVRKDEFSLTAHQKLYDSFSGAKIEYKSNER